MKVDQLPTEPEVGKSSMNGTIVEKNKNGQSTKSKNTHKPVCNGDHVTEAVDGPGDLLVEDATKNAETEIPYGNGTKLDDSNSLSSSSSHVANIELEDELSDDMTLRISEDEDGGSEIKKDSLQSASFTATVPTVDNNSELENSSSTIQSDNLDKTNNSLMVDQVPESVDSNCETVNNVETSELMEVDKVDPNENALDVNESDSNIINENHSKHVEESTVENNSCKTPSQMDESDEKNSLTISELRQEIEEFIKSDDDDDDENVDSSKLSSSVDDDNKDSLINLSDVSAETELTNKDSTEIEDSETILPIIEYSETIMVDPNENTNDQSDTNIETALSSDELLTHESGIFILEADSANTTNTLNSNEDSIGTIPASAANVTEIEQIDETTEVELTPIEAIPIENDMNSYEKDNDTEEFEHLLVPMEVDPTESDNLNEEISEEGTSSPIDKASETSETVADITSSLLEVLRETETSEDILDENTAVKDSQDSNSSSLDTQIKSIGKQINVSMSPEMPDRVNEDQTETVVSEKLDELQLVDEVQSVSIGEESMNTEVHTVDTSETIVDNASKLDIAIKDDLTHADDSKESKTPTLKRALESSEADTDAKKSKLNDKKVKSFEEIKNTEYVTLANFKAFMDKRKIEHMTRSELEEFVLQKMCEVLNQHSRTAECGRTIRLHAQQLELQRTRIGILAKQVKDLETVHNRIIHEVRLKAKEGGNIKEATPVKITRSVGLQVSLQPIAPVRIRPGPEPDPTARMPPMPKKKLQRASLPSKLTSIPQTIQPLGPPLAAPLKPKAASPKPVPGSPKLISPVSPGASKGIKTILPKVYGAATTKVKDTQANGPVLANYLQKPAGQIASVRKSIETPKVIDLTDEDDTNKTVTSIPANNIRVVASHQLTNTINTASTSTVTAAANSNLPRLTYFVQTPGQPGQPVLLAQSSAPTRPGQPRPTLMFKQVPQGQVPPGQRLNLVRPAMAGTMNVLQQNSPQNIRPGQIRYTNVQQVQNQAIISRPRHPAPLPGPPAVQPSQPNWKAMPPKPNLKISRVGDGIVLSWKMLNKDMSRYEEIASYQLYAYQETNGAPSTDMWRKVGDVKALALPMACTLTQFTDGNKYHFAVRAVDVKSRVGPFSPPEQIALP